jgi:hypothetical protein
MPRIDRRTTKIAYSILGTPANMKKIMTRRQEWIERRLRMEETSRVR